MEEAEEQQHASPDLVEEEGVNAGSGVPEPDEDAPADVTAGGHPEEAPDRPEEPVPDELVGSADHEQGQMRSIREG